MVPQVLQVVQSHAPNLVVCVGDVRRCRSPMAQRRNGPAHPTGAKVEKFDSGAPLQSAPTQWRVGSRWSIWSSGAKIVELCSRGDYWDLGRTNSPTLARRGDDLGFIRIWATPLNRLIGAPNPSLFDHASRKYLYTNIRLWLRSGMSTVMLATKACELFDRHLTDRHLTLHDDANET